MTEQKKTTTYILLGQGFNQAYTNVAFGGTLTLFLLKLGVREFLLGILAILGPIIGVFSIFFIFFIQKNFGKYLYASVVAMTILGFLLLPIFPMADKFSYASIVVYFFAFAVFYLIANQIFALTFLPMVTNFIPEHERGFFFGQLRFFIMALSLFLLYYISKILGKNPLYGQFFSVFSLLAIIQALSIIFFSKIPLPSESSDVRKHELLDGIKVIFNQKGIRKFFYFLFINTFLAGLGGPFLIPFFRLSLHLSSSFCVSLMFISILGYAISVYAWGKINDKLGSKFVLFSSFLYSPVFWFTLANLKSFNAQYLHLILNILYFCSGISNAGFQMAATTRRMILAPHTNRFSFYSHLMIYGEQLPVIIASPLAGFILEKNKNFVLGSYTIYPLLFIFIVIINIYLLFYIINMESLEEKPLKKIFTEVLSYNLLKFRNILSSPP